MSLKVLITREISERQEGFCIKIGLKPVVKPFVRIAYLAIDTEELIHKTQNNPVWVFTSVNAVKAFSRYLGLIDVKDKIAYAIGERTEFELKRIEGLSVRLKDEYAPNFFQEIKKENAESSIAYFCGNLSREKNKSFITNFDKMVLYETNFLTTKVDNGFDTVVFFSPSAVKAFAKSGNSLPKNIPIFTIGSITMNEIIMHFQNTTIITNGKKFETVMEEVKSYFKEVNVQN